MTDFEVINRVLSISTIEMNRIYLMDIWGTSGMLRKEPENYFYALLMKKEIEATALAGF